MKKVLLTTTVLALSATVAAADVSLKGFARAGVAQDANGDNSLMTRFQIDASGGVTTDGGLTLSANSRLRIDNNRRQGNAAGAGGDGAFNTPQVTMGMGGVTIAVGNTNDAMGARGNPFATCVGETGNMCAWDPKGIYSSWGTGEMDMMRADIAMGGATVSLSGDLQGDASQIGVSSSFGAVNVGAGMGFGADDDEYVVDINGDLGGVTIGYRVTDVIGAAYINYSAGAVGVQAYAADDETQAIGMTYDLGGATLGAAANNDGASEVTIGFSF